MRCLGRATDKLQEDEAGEGWRTSWREREQRHWYRKVNHADMTKMRKNDLKALERPCPQFMQLHNDTSRKNCTVGRIIQTRRCLCLSSFSGLPCVKDWSKQGSTGTHELQGKRLPGSFPSLFCLDFECHILVHGTGKDGGVGITMPVVQMLRPGMGSSGGRYTCLWVPDITLQLLRDVGLCVPAAGCLPQTLKEVLTPGGEESIAYRFRPQRYPELPGMGDMCQAGSPSMCGSCCLYSHHQAPCFQNNSKRQRVSEAISPVK